jgi:putative ABC transport system ATP-binding protein
LGIFSRFIGTVSWAICLLAAAVLSALYAFGSIIGLSLTALTIFPFSTYIGDRLGLPFLLSDSGHLAAAFLFSLIVSLASETVSAVFTAVKLSKGGSLYHNAGGRVGMAVVITNLTKEYSRGGRAFKAVNSANLSLSPGDFISIIGKSGSGKSTLLNMIAGLTIPTSGSVSFDDNELFSLSDTEISNYRNLKIGYVPQGQSLLSKLTILENVLLPFHMAEKPGDGAETAEKILEKVGISHLSGSYPKHLSGGEMKRAAIARALINSPEILLVDEPTGDLDARTTDDVLSLIMSARDRGTAVLMVTHDTDAVNYSNRRYEMRSGTLLESAK